MINYTMNEWVARAFPNGFTHVVNGNFSDPQRASQAADDLLCYSRTTGTATIFATVKNGRLDSGRPVVDGPLQVAANLTFGNHRWDQIVVGPFGQSGAQILFYDANASVGHFYGLDAAGNLRFISENTRWRQTWTKIIAGKFSGDDGEQLLFHDAAAGVGEFYAVDKTGQLRLLRSNNRWRNTWNAIVPGKFSDSRFNDLLFYDRAGGTGEFYHNDGHGGITLFSSHTNWRTTWRGINSGSFSLGGKYDGLVFYEDGTGTTEFYTTDGKASIVQQPVFLGGSWPSRAGQCRRCCRVTSSVAA